jgi:excisionase family DNA binding protein
MPKSSRPIGKFYTIHEIADLLGISQRTVHRWTASRQLSAYKIGGLLRVGEDDLRAFLALRRSS